ncbi:fungal-specific transcription factor domain-containing protein [Aspergillus pseudoustus]|uniref:Fungal-specific transcription factor domain-containing protein n=1 Tax=Aspergillus pseudoustus TaxID=1810923 RepID=A0ABR4KIJ8_9EURO
MPNSPKRRRVPLACRNCRERKVRCDGGRPVYLVIAETAKYQTERTYIQLLRDQISLLESSVSLPPAALDCSPNAITSLPIPEIGERKRRNDTQCLHYPSPATPSLPSSISAMGAPVTDIREDDIREQYHECAHAGPAHQGPRTRHSLATSSTTSPASCNVSCASGPSTLLSDDYSLPPRKTVDWLLNIFFTNSHLFYPWVHKESFMTSYDFIWSNEQGWSLTDLPDVGLGGQNCPTPVFYCALNAILTTACEKKGLINIDIFDSGSLAHVQALLLIAMYLQCTSYPKRCWNIVGVSYRMSVGLGLHLGRQADTLSRLEREIRWRVWCGCVHMDMVVSMTMGRPAMTPSPYRVPLPSPIDDKYLAMGEDVEQPTDIVSGNQFLYENTKLIGILGKVLCTIYHSSEITPDPNTPSRPEVDLQAVLDIDTALDEFEASLHPALHWAFGRRPDDNVDVTCKRLSNVLRARFSHLRLLLYRPAFSEYCSRATEDGKSTNGVAQQGSILGRANCAAGCVQAACDLIQSLAAATMQDATGAWWYGIFYLESAGITLLLAESSGAVFDRSGQAQRHTAWELCIQTLHRMVDVHSSARDYAIALSGLKLSHQSAAHASPEAGSPYDFTGMSWGGDGSPEQGGASAVDSELDTFLSHWDYGVGDIMLPAKLLRKSTRDYCYHACSSNT